MTIASKAVRTVQSTLCEQQHESHVLVLPISTLAINREEHCH